MPELEMKMNEIMEMLRSKRYQDLIGGFRQHRLSEPLCQKCTFRRRFDQ